MMPSLAAELEGRQEHYLQPSSSQEPVICSNLPVFRFPIRGHERGTLILDVAMRSNLDATDRRLCLCVSKSAQVINEDGDSELHWISGLAPSWRCRISTQMWAYSSPEAVVVPLLRSEALQLPADAPEFVGVEFENLPEPPSGLTSSGPDSDAILAVSLRFESEISLLPQELRPAHKAFHEAYEAIDGVELSASGKDAMGRAGDMELIYGEVQLVPFWRVFDQAVRPRAGEVLVDLGSGTGRAVVAAALRFTDLKTCFGFEVVPDLHMAAESVKSRLTSDSTLACAPLEFCCNDFKESPWEAWADIVWISSLCMSEATLRWIRAQCTRLKPGSRVVTMDACFADDDPHAFEQVSVEGCSRIEVEMSFGDAGVYVFLVKGSISLSSID
mmetsp:Transcript_6692/g.14666  ORF Transcript_6692/g.14666 Transcript_6692/m.14666 type:complete len:387 (-) Transcript_6692:9-1169(-)